MCERQANQVFVGVCATLLGLMTAFCSQVAAQTSNGVFSGTFTGIGQVFGPVPSGVTCVWDETWTQTLTIFLGSQNSHLSLTGPRVGVPLDPIHCGPGNFFHNYQNIPATVAGLSISATIGTASVGIISISGQVNQTNGTLQGVMQYIPPAPFMSTVQGNFTLQLQTSSCGLSSSAQTFTSAGGLGSFFVTSAPCATTPASATTPDSWITLLPGPYVCALPTPTSSCPPPPTSGSVQFAIAKNPSGSGRTGQIFVSDQTFNVTQAGVSSACSFTVSPASQLAVAAGGPLTPVTVLASSNSCSWDASVTAVRGLQITSVPFGTGNGIVTLSASPNTGAARTLTVTIAGQTVLVQQIGSGLVCGATDVSSFVTINKTSFTSGWPGGILFGIGLDAETITITNDTGSTLDNLWLVLHNLPYSVFPPGGYDYVLFSPPSQFTACFRTPPEQMLPLGNLGPGQTITEYLTFEFFNIYRAHGITTTTVLSGAPNK